MGFAHDYMMARLGAGPGLSGRDRILTHWPESAAGQTASFIARMGLPLQALTVEIRPVQAGSGDPSPDNIRPITGWTGAKITRSGLNLLSDKWYSTSFSFSGVTGTKVGDLFMLGGTSTAASGLNWYIKRYGTDTSFDLEPGTYTFSGLYGEFSTGNTPVLSLYRRKDDNTGNEIIAQLYKRQGYDTKTITLTERKTNCFLVLSVSSGVSTEGYSAKPMLQFGSEATAFAPYYAETVEIAFPDEAGTVYGGTLDVTNGVLTVTHGYRTFDGTGQWGMAFTAAGQNPCFTGPTNSCRGAQDHSGVFSHFKYAKINSDNLTTGAEVYVSGANANVKVRYDNQPDTADGFKAVLAQWYANGTPLQVVYPLATPVVYQLTPVEVSAIKGQNHVWADCGDVSLVYLK